MANKKVSQLTSKPSVLVTDLFPIADPTTGQLFKTTISALGTAIGSGVSSVNTLVGAVVLDTDDIQELASPTNRYFTDTRARAALSASSPLVYNSGTGAFSIPAATTSVNGYLTSADWTTFNGKQAALSGTGFVKISGTTISYDNSTYLTTSAAASTYLALAGGTLTGALNGTSANFSGDLTLTGTNPRFYLTDSDNNPDYFISNTDGTFTIYDVTNSVSRLTINSTTATLGANLTATSLIKSGGTSSQFLKADGSVDSTAYVSGSGATGRYAIWTGTGVISDGFIQTTSNITYVEGMGLSTLNGIEINGNFGSGSGTAGLKIKSYDETTGKAFIEFINTSGVFRLGIESSTGGSILPGSTAYATVLTSGLTAKNLELGTNNTKRLTIDGTTGAVTLTSTISATGGTLTGALSGTSATFTTGISATNGYGFTSSLSTESITFSNSWFGGIDAIFQNSGNNNDFGIYTNGGTSTQAKFYITNAGNVGIGTTAPGALMHLTQNATNLNLYLQNTNGSGKTWAVNSDNAGSFNIHDTTANIFTINSNGFTLLSTFTYSNTTTNLPNLFIDTTGGLYRSTTSSKRNKDNISLWTGSGLDTILALKPKTFNYKPEYYKYPEEEMLGLIAEEVAEVAPYLAEYENQDRTGLVTNVKYATIVVPLIKAIQELEAKIKILENK